MKRRRALLKYDDAPPSASGLEVSVYLADEVDEVLKRQASAAVAGMNAAKAISSNDVQRAARLRAESSPDALESERQANAKLTQELSLAEEGLANYAQDHKQYVDWATPQLERLGREMVENGRLRKQLSARLQELERIKRKRLDWAMLCDHDCPACTELDDAIRGDVPQSPPHAAEQDAK